MHTYSPLCAQWQQQVKDFLGSYTVTKAKDWPCLCGERSKPKVSCWHTSPRSCCRKVRPKRPVSNGDCNAMSRNERIEVEAVWGGLSQCNWHLLERARGGIGAGSHAVRGACAGGVCGPDATDARVAVSVESDAWANMMRGCGTSPLFTRVKRALGEADCTLLADRGLSGLPLIALCQAQGWHWVLRIKQEEQCRPWRRGAWQAWQPVCQLVPHVGRSWYGKVLYWLLGSSV